MLENAHEKTTNAVLKALKTSPKGLNPKEAKSRLAKYGENTLEQEKQINVWKILFEQFSSFLIIILIVAAVFSFIIGEKTNATIIIIVVLLNGFLGFFQNYKAERSVKELKKMVSHKATVLRDGKKLIDTILCVPGDIVVLEEGNKIPADCRIIQANNLFVDESILTGESIPVEKISEIIKNTLSIGDKKNMLFSGTNVVKGTALAVIVGTGKKTELGKIAGMLAKEKDETPLQKRIAKLGKNLGIVMLLMCAVVFLYAGLKYGDFTDAFMLSITLAVAAVPEALPFVITVSLSFGVKRMTSKMAFIRRLPAVETLGSTDVICTDKTGTLTMNEMTVRKFYYDGEISEKGSNLLLKIGAVCNNAKLGKQKLGDPTEIALLLAAANIKYSKKRTKEIPFDSKRKMMSVVSDNIIYTKGGVEQVLAKCNRIQINGKIKKLTPKYRREIKKALNEMANSALRVLAFAYKKGSTEKDLIFVGLQGMMDPPRQEAKDSIRKAHEAGIDVKMITGDYKDTAVAIGKEVGIVGKVLTGVELEKMNDKQFRKVVEKIAIFSRVSPSHKYRIVEALKKKGHILAMTGDGVNDAPALKNADIGIAMGIKGNDVSKEASEMILMDDHFKTIISAIEEGRRIYDNIKKFVKYTLWSNFSEITVVLGALIMGYKVMPLIPIYLLWINILTDGLPAQALGVDPAGKNIMKRKPEKEHAIINSEFIKMNIVVVVTFTTGILWLFQKYLDDPVRAQTIAFTSMVLYHLMMLVFVRIKYDKNPFSNKWLLIAVILSVLLQLLVVYVLGEYFKTVPLNLADWMWMIGVGIILYIVNLIAYRIIEWSENVKSKRVASRA